MKKNHSLYHTQQWKTESFSLKSGKGQGCTSIQHGTVNPKY